MGILLLTCFCHWSDSNQPEYSTGEFEGIRVPMFKQEHPIQINWCFYTGQGSTWFSGTGIGEDGELLYKRNKSLGTIEIDDDDEKMIRSITNIIFQVLLTLVVYPELETPLHTSKVNHRKRRKKSSKQQQWWNPRILGAEFESSSKLRKVTTGAGSHSSPRPHWRKSHWRRVACWGKTP